MCKGKGLLVLVEAVLKNPVDMHSVSTRLLLLLFVDSFKKLWKLCEMNLWINVKQMGRVSAAFVIGMTYLHKSLVWIFSRNHNLSMCLLLVVAALLIRCLQWGYGDVVSCIQRSSSWTDVAVTSLCFSINRLILFEDSIVELLEHYQMSTLVLMICGYSEFLPKSSPDPSFEDYFSKGSLLLSLNLIEDDLLLKETERGYHSSCSFHWSSIRSADGVSRACWKMHPTSFI